MADDMLNRSRSENERIPCRIGAAVDIELQILGMQRFVFPAVGVVKGAGGPDRKPRVAPAFRVVPVDESGVDIDVHGRGVETIVAVDRAIALHLHCVAILDILTILIPIGHTV